MADKGRLPKARSAASRQIQRKKEARGAGVFFPALILFVVLCGSILVLVGDMGPKQAPPAAPKEQTQPKRPSVRVQLQAVIRELAAAEQSLEVANYASCKMQVRKAQDNLITLVGEVDGDDDTGRQGR